ncbi:DUF454 domain-containing protein [Hwanghaeella grinnelliae]|uniref:DUF454 domain-containing protein n=1 Tax=Hwanghaeella grinnelliae TaxID=2500179 RepID=A0A3S2VQP8_9PROT|nr:DUF454 domain-containing protein [Hwanghaeella grinnelliae]
MTDVTNQPAKVDCPLRSRIVLNALGYFFFGLGIVGMFLPVMPTTVFWILSAVCFAKSNPALYRRIVAHKRFGRGVRNLVEMGVISRRSKIAAVTGMTVAAAIVLFTVPSGIWITVALCLIGAGACFVVSRPEQVVLDKAGRS